LNRGGQNYVVQQAPPVRSGEVAPPTSVIAKNDTSRTSGKQREKLPLL
jgi:hypothetical protein